MKSKFVVPIISFILIIITVVSAFVAVSVEKNKEIRLDESDVSFSNITVDGKKVKITITAANSLGFKITGNSYVFENGVLKFKLFGKKDLTIGEPLTKNQVIDLVITAPGDIEEIFFSYIDSKGEEKETKKSYVRGKF